MLFSHFKLLQFEVFRIRAEKKKRENRLRWKSKEAKDEKELNSFRWLQFYPDKCENIIPSVYYTCRSVHKVLVEHIHKNLFSQFVVVSIHCTMRPLKLRKFHLFTGFHSFLFFSPLFVLIIFLDYIGISFDSTSTFENRAHLAIYHTWVKNENTLDTYAHSRRIDFFFSREILISTRISLVHARPLHEFYSEHMLNIMTKYDFERKKNGLEGATMRDYTSTKTATRSDSLCQKNQQQRRKRI